MKTPMEKLSNQKTGRTPELASFHFLTSASAVKSLRDENGLRFSGPSVAFGELLRV